MDVLEFRDYCLSLPMTEESTPFDETTLVYKNKRHWNGIRTTGDLPDSFIREQVRNSYLLVLRRNVTPRALRDELMAYVERTGLPE